MAYSTIDDIRKQLPEATIIQLTDDEKLNPATIDPEDEDCVKIISRIDEAVAAADGTIDAYCQSRYVIPLSPVPPKIRQISVDIAVYNLYSRKTLSMPEIRTERNKESLRFLEKVADGKIRLGASSPLPADSESSGSAASFGANDRIFTTTKMKGF